jgi:hypothetical protein
VVKQVFHAAVDDLGDVLDELVVLDDILHVSLLGELLHSQDKVLDCEDWSHDVV